MFTQCAAQRKTLRAAVRSLTGKSTLTSEPSSSRTRQEMMLLAVPAAGMWTDAPPLTTAGAWTTCCWWARSRGFPVTPPAPPPAPPPPLPSRSSLSLVWKRDRERRLNVRRRKPIIFLIHKARWSVLCLSKLFHTTVAAAEVLLLLPSPPPRPLRGEESLSRHGGDFRAADQSSGWMSAAARGLQPHTNESNTDRPTRRQPIDFQSFSPVWTTGLSRKYSTNRPPRLSCPLQCTCLLFSSLLRTDSNNHGEIPTDAPQ